MERLLLDTADQFHLLYSRYYKALMLYALKMTNDTKTAEDIVQNAFLSLWETRESFVDEKGVCSFLYLSVRHRAIDNARHLKVEGKYKEYVLGAADCKEEDTADRQAWENEIYRRLFDAINELPPRQREIFTLYMKGKKNTEIAKAMCITEETIRVQKRRALKTLQKKIGERDFLFLLLLSI